MSAWTTRLIALVALVLACAVGARAAWMWQANTYGRQLAVQADDYGRQLAVQADDYGKQLAEKDRVYGLECEEAATAALNQLVEQRDARRALEARLQDQTKTHWKEMNDAQ